MVGGAGGIGRASLAALLRDGFECAVLDLATVLDDLGDGSVSLAVPVDAADYDSMQHAICEVVKCHGRLDVLVNAAGIAQIGSIDDVSPEDWRRVLAVNLDAVFFACRAAYPHLRQRAGAVVNVSSVSGRTKSMFTAPNYVASKAGVIGLTFALAAQWASDNVRVNCVAPGPATTGMHAMYAPEQIDRMTAAIPMGRFADPAEIADAIAYLAGQHAAYITGEVLNVNGGLFMA